MKTNKNNRRPIMSSINMRDYRSFDSYDYKGAVYEDALSYCKEQIRQEDLRYDDRDEAYEDLNDRCWAADDVTGNASGSYTMNTYLAEVLLAGNWDLIDEAYSEFGGPFDISEGAEAADVTVRCYMLGHVMDAVLDQLEEDGDLVYEDEDDEE